MSNDQLEEPVDESDSTPQSRPSRRRFLQAAAAAGAIGAAGRIAAQDGAPDFVFGGDTEAWMGREPEEIADEENPTLTFEEGETYVVEWENVDGQPHNFAIEDADGNNLVESEVISEQGATQQVEFEATRAMSEYYCVVHPESMRGDISLGEETGDEDEAEETPEGRPAVGEGFFPEGPSVGVSTVAEGMTAPTDFAMAEDGRMFVTDQTGELWAVEDGERREEPVLDVTDRMVTLGEFNGSYADPESEYDERGLLGVDLHPEFADNGRMFVHYSAPPNDETPEGWDHVEVVSEFQTTEGGETVDPDSEQVLMEFQSPQYNHDSGPMAFGPDGYLYVPMGDGGGANDEMYGHVEDWYDENAGGNGQNVTENLLGGVHRIDVDGDGGDDDTDGEDRPYAIPEDNPLVGEDGMDEYYAWGFRNPFGITFDSEGRMIVADAGQNLFEEANVVEQGGNYGWNVKEGTHCFSTDDPGEPPAECPDSTPDDVRGGEELLDPIVEYPHSYQGQPEGIVIAGGHVYEADEISELQGQYVFGDWTRDVARADPDGRVLVASEPDGGGATDDDSDTAGNETAGNATAGNDTVGNETADDGMADNETGAAGNETTGNETDSASPEETVPRDELWDMAELRFEGSEDGRLNRFVRQFGQGTDGEVFVLVNQRGVPDGDTGAVLELVPPDEGEEISTPEPTPTETPVEDPGEEPGNETAENETVENETAGNETVGNETVDNETIGNETVGNETADNETGGNATAGNVTVGNDTTGNETDE